MTCNIAATPFDIEPLPLYRRDPETSSLLSSAPSYTSEAPTYHSSARDSQIVGPDQQAQQRQRRQPQPYYVSTSLLDISTPPPTRSRNTAAAAVAATTITSEPPAPTNRQQDSSDAQRLPPVPRPAGGLPSPTFAPGFTSRAPMNVAMVASDADACASSLQSGYNMGAWSSVRAGSHLQQRQYERVAMRRASRAAGIDRTKAVLESMKLGSGGGGGGDNPPSPMDSANSGGRAETIPPSPSTSAEAQVGDGSGSNGGGGVDEGSAWEAGTEMLAVSAPDGGAGAADATAAEVSAASLSASEPTLPLEDPALVGEHAAKKARQQRLYREACLRQDGDMRLVQENKSWDFMLSQMADWEERERSWGRFRSEVERRQGRIHAMGVGIGRLSGFAIGDGARSGGKKWPFGKGKSSSR
ncbi:uncharacterized protein BKCO1_11500016 [Diplodia corticola]|uniref:Uncharacterized protein n=1 Tax=Diplodia corticola TaxID=236234 RepID=A0A1J9QKZ6_9PEZI|nr:uncharacterized protein BKCO1_11500016 [Diplodia corticola]OJD28738.1 hypothetical protein BKCO1_11500016 [Diplodia corticola]